LGWLDASMPRKRMQLEGVAMPSVLEGVEMQGNATGRVEMQGDATGGG